MQIDKAQIFVAQFKTDFESERKLELKSLLVMKGQKRNRGARKMNLFYLIGGTMTL